MTTNYRIKTPGKLMIAGEYAILEPGNQCIVAAVDRYVTVDITEDVFFNVSIQAWSLEKLSWEWHGRQLQWKNIEAPELLKKLSFFKNAIEVVHDYLGHDQGSDKAYAIDLTSQLDDESTGRKYGLGSSGAVVVAAIASVMRFYASGSSSIDLGCLFKLAYTAHFRCQGNGSGADIAASVYGGWVRYVPVDRSWHNQQIKEATDLKTMLSLDWPELLIQPLLPPASLELLVGWTGNPVATGPMIEHYQNFCTIHPEVHGILMEKIKSVMEEILLGFGLGSTKEIIQGIRSHRQWLKSLDSQGTLGIETGGLKLLCDLADHQGSGKSSGAGGGDCGIAIVTSLDKRKALIQAWGKAGIHHLDLKISKGVSVETFDT